MDVHREDERARLHACAGGVVVLRRAAPLSPGWTGGLALLSAGSLAMLGTRMLCPKDDPRHVLLSHFGPLLLAAVLGIRLGRWSLSRRPLRP